MPNILIEKYFTYLHIPYTKKQISDRNQQAIEPLSHGYQNSFEELVREVLNKILETT